MYALAGGALYLEVAPSAVELGLESALPWLGRLSRFFIRF